MKKFLMLNKILSNSDLRAISETVTEENKVELKKFSIELILKHYPNIECSDVIAKAKDVYQFLADGIDFEKSCNIKNK